MMTRCQESMGGLSIFWRKVSPPDLAGTRGGAPLTGEEKKDIHTSYAGHGADTFSGYRLRSTTTEIIYGPGYY